MAWRVHEKTDLSYARLLATLARELQLRDVGVAASSSAPGQSEFESMYLEEVIVVAGIEGGNCLCVRESGVYRLKGRFHRI